MALSSFSKHKNKSQSLHETTGRLSARNALLDRLEIHVMRFNSAAEDLATGAQSNIHLMHLHNSK